MLFGLRAVTSALQKIVAKVHDFFISAKQQKRNLLTKKKYFFCEYSFCEKRLVIKKKIVTLHAV